MKNLRSINNRAGARRLLCFAAASVILTLAFATSGLAQDTKRTEPLSERFIYEAIRSHALGEDFLMGKITELGVDFQLTDDVKRTLRKYGASNELFAVIEANYRPGDPAKVTLLPGGYVGKIGEAKDAKVLRLQLRADGDKIAGTVYYDKKSGKITDGECKGGRITAQFEIEKQKGVITGNYQDGRIRGELVFGGQTEKVKLNWVIDMKSDGQS